MGNTVLKPNQELFEQVSEFDSEKNDSQNDNLSLNDEKMQTKNYIHGQQKSSITQQLYNLTGTMFDQQQSQKIQNKQNLKNESYCDYKETTNFSSNAEYNINESLQPKSINKRNSYVPLSSPYQRLTQTKKSGVCEEDQQNADHFKNNPMSGQNSQMKLNNEERSIKIISQDLRDNNPFRQNNNCDNDDDDEDEEPANTFTSQREHSQQSFGNYGIRIASNEFSVTASKKPQTEIQQKMSQKNQKVQMSYQKSKHSKNSSLSHHKYESSVKTQLKTEGSTYDERENVQQLNRINENKLIQKVIESNQRLPYTQQKGRQTIKIQPKNYIPIQNILATSEQESRNLQKQSYYSKIMAQVQSQVPPILKLKDEQSKWVTVQVELGMEFQIYFSDHPYYTCGWLQSEVVRRYYEELEKQAYEQKASLALQKQVQSDTCNDTNLKLIHNFRRNTREQRMSTIHQHVTLKKKFIVALKTFDNREGLDYYLTQYNRPLSALPHKEQLRAHFAKLTFTQSELATNQLKVSKNDFEQLKVIGVGGFSRVILVRKKDTGRLYAMKIMRKDKLIREQKVKAVINERLIMEKINNQFIIKLYWAFQSKTELFFVIDLCTGGEIFFHLGKVAKFSEEHAKFYFAELLLGLEYLHAKDIVYRDIKPENILIDIDGHVKIADFGLSKIIHKKEKSYSFCGSPEYMCPEILKAIGHDRRADIYCIGTLLYELVVGYPPHFSQDQNQIYHGILYNEVDFNDLNISSELEDLLKKLLVKNPEHRIQKISEIKNHPWLKDISWTKVLDREYTPPIVPGPLECCIDEQFLNLPLDFEDSNVHVTTERRQSCYHESTVMLKTVASKRSNFKGDIYQQLYNNLNDTRNFSMSEDGNYGHEEKHETERGDDLFLAEITPREIAVQTRIDNRDIRPSAGGSTSGGISGIRQPQDVFNSQDSKPLTPQQLLKSQIANEKFDKNNTNYSTSQNNKKTDHRDIKEQTSFSDQQLSDDSLLDQKEYDKIKKDDLIIEGLKNFEFVNTPQEEIELRTHFNKFIEQMQINELQLKKKQETERKSHKSKMKEGCLSDHSMNITQSVGLELLPDGIGQEHGQDSMQSILINSQYKYKSPNLLQSYSEFQNQFDQDEEQKQQSTIERQLETQKKLQKQYDGDGQKTQRGQLLNLQQEKEILMKQKNQIADFISQDGDHNTLSPPKHDQSPVRNLFSKGVFKGVGNRASPQMIQNRDGKANNIKQSKGEPTKILRKPPSSQLNLNSPQNKYHLSTNKNEESLKQSSRMGSGRENSVNPHNQTPSQINLYQNIKQQNFNGQNNPQPRPYQSFLPKHNEIQALGQSNLQETKSQESKHLSKSPINKKNNQGFKTQIFASQLKSDILVRKNPGSLSGTGLSKLTTNSKVGSTKLSEDGSFKKLNGTKPPLIQNNPACLKLEQKHTKMNSGINPKNKQSSEIPYEHGDFYVDTDFHNNQQIDQTSKQLYSAQNNSLLASSFMKGPNQNQASSNWKKPIIPSTSPKIALSLGTPSAGSNLSSKKKNYSNDTMSGGKDGSMGEQVSNQPTGFVANNPNLFSFSMPTPMGSQPEDQCEDRRMTQGQEIQSIYNQITDSKVCTQFNKLNADLNQEHLGQKKQPARVVQHISTPQTYITASGGRKGQQKYNSGVIGCGSLIRIGQTQQMNTPQSKGTYVPFGDRNQANNGNPLTPISRASKLS